MKAKKIHSVMLTALLVFGATVAGCTSDDPGKDRQRDPCANQGFSGCADPLLQYMLEPELLNGEYRVTVESPEGVQVCTAARLGENDVGTPIYTTECDDAAFEEIFEVDRYGLLFHNWMPETIAITIEALDGDCSISQSDEPHYEAQYFECSEDICIDAFSKWDISTLLACTQGMGGAGGESGD